MKEVKQYVEGCDQCQRMKNRAEMPAGKLRLNEVPEKPWQHILVDFIMKLLVLKGYDSILVVYNRFLKNISLCGDNRKNNGRRVGEVVQRLCVEVAWVAGECNIR